MELKYLTCSFNQIIVKEFQSHLYGIEILLPVVSNKPTTRSNRTFMELKCLSLDLRQKLK